MNLFKLHTNPEQLDMWDEPYVTTHKHYELGKIQLTFINGLLQSFNGTPALENEEGYKEWYNKGKRHRTTGPAVLHPDGFHQYWIDGELMMDQTEYDIELEKQGL